MNLMVCLILESLSKILFYFLDLYELNRNTYKRVRAWFDQLDPYRRTLISHRLETYPLCDDLIQGSGKYLHLFIVLEYFA